MTLPSEVVTRQVTYKLLFTALDPSDPAGAPITVAPAAGSSATFTAGPASLLLVDGSTTLDMLPQPRTVAIGSDGAITATLECTDTDKINPVDWAWTVSFSLSGGMTAAPFAFQLPAGSGALDLATVVPVSDAGGVLTTRGEIGPRGPAGIEPQGTWDSGTAYATDDAVYRNGSTYWAVQPSTGVDPATDTNSTYWHIMAEKGDPGDVSSVDGVTADVAGNVALGALRAASNLSDVADPATARGNIGAGTSSFSGAYGDLTGKPTLGTAAAVNTGTTSGTVPLLNASGQLDMARLASGTPDGSKFVRDDGTLATPSAASLTTQSATIPSNVTLTTTTWVTWQTITLGAGTWLITVSARIAFSNSNCSTRASAGTGAPTLAGVVEMDPGPAGSSAQNVALTFIATVTTANSTVLLQSYATAASNTGVALTQSGYTAVKIA